MDPIPSMHSHTVLSVKQLFTALANAVVYRLRMIVLRTCLNHTPKADVLADTKSKCKALHETYSTSDQSATTKGDTKEIPGSQAETLFPGSSLPDTVG